MKKKTIALLAGGFTGEYEVSINSATNIAANLNVEKYEVYPVLIRKDGWFYGGGAHEVAVDKNDFSLTLNGNKINFDFAFITVHGSPGEDGKIQGYLDMLDIPYNTCDATTSAITMNKAFTKAQVSGIEGLNLSKSIRLSDDDPQDAGRIVEQLKFPLFIKPNNGGSSVGMSKVYHLAELPKALEKAFHEDGEILVEEFIKGREFSIGATVFGTDIRVLPATEIIFNEDFFDYHAKYHSKETKEVTPAALDPEKYDQIAGIVRAVCKRLNCHGMVRIDFILQEQTNDFYFIEINTTPGQSAASLIPQQVRAANIKLEDFYSELIERSL